MLPSSFTEFQPRLNVEHESHRFTAASIPPTPPPNTINEGATLDFTTSDVKLICTFPECSDVTFGRPTDLKRHREAFHTNVVLWCPAFDCPRNADYGTDPFALIRRDKLMEHIRKMHKSTDEKRL